MPRTTTQRLYEAAYRRAGRVYTAAARPLLYVPTHTAQALDEDLRRAGIPKVTHDGTLVFHALRNTYGTLLDSVGASAKDTQVMMRHSTVDLTMNRYVRENEDRQRILLERAVALVQQGSQGDPDVQQGRGGQDEQCQHASGGGGNRTRVRKPSTTASTCLSGEKVSHLPNLPSWARKLLARFRFRSILPQAEERLG
jgi:hypothetical protein